MTQLELSTILRQDWKSAYKLLENLEGFSQLIAGVEKVHVRRISDDTKVSEWVINIDGLRIAWKEEEIFDPISGQIRFRMVEGPFERYEGLWKIAQVERDMAHLVFSVNIGWGRLRETGESEDELDRKAKLAVRWMLRRLRETSGPHTVVQHEHVQLSVDQPIVSEFITYQNRRGKSIAGIYDHLRQVGSDEPLVIIPPGYGETKRDSLTLAYYLAQNGFRVLRYDATDHLGESEGDIFYTTLPKMKEDLVATLDFAESRFQARQCAVIASSLAKRVAIRAALEDPRICLLVSLVGIVDIQATLKAVYYRDIIGAFLEGRGWDVADILGFEVSREFPETAIREGYHDLSTTVEEVRKLKIPIIFLVAEKDAWVKLEDVRVVFEAVAHEGRELHVIPDTMHRIYENPRSTRWALKQIVASCSKWLKQEKLNPDGVKEPNVRDIAAQNRVEKNRLRTLRKMTKDEEKEFWGKYLSDYILITKSPDFRNLLSLADLMLGPPRQGERILDAGCGNGHYGAWLIWSTAAKVREAQENGVSLKNVQREYVGFDFVPSALSEASRRLTSIREEIETRSGKQTGLQFSFILGDLDQKLPFPDNFFDKVCCNLVISYVGNPKFTMRELMRVLKPKGRIVVTSLKPYADLSQVYRNFVVQSASEAEIEEARKILSNAGKIRKKEEEGQYQFFSENKLRSLASGVGGLDIKSFQTFGDQSYLVVGSKS